MPGFVEFGDEECCVSRGVLCFGGIDFVFLSSSVLASPISSSAWTACLVAVISGMDFVLRFSSRMQ